MTPHKRTGKQRHRVQTRLFRSPLLVLQEEWEGYDPDPMYECVRRYWKDAHPEHFLRKDND